MIVSMFVLDVIPFSRGGIVGSLSYRSRENLPVGTIVEVSLRRARVRGIVVGSSNVLEVKALLKSASFLLGSSTVVSLGTLPTEIIKAAQAVAAYHAVPLSGVLAALFAETLPDTLPDSVGIDGGYRIQAIEVPLARRFIEYHKIIAQGVPDKSTTLLVAPTLAEVERFVRLYAEYRPVVLSGSQTGKRRAEALGACATGPALIITTPAFSWVPIARLHSIIVERPSAGTYRQQKRPYLDMLASLRILAEHRAVPFILGDYPLPLEYRPNPEAGIAEAVSGTVQIIDIQKKADESETAPWQAVPAPMREAIAATLKNDGRVAVLAVRRGYAPAVVCRDCGTTVRDAQGRGLSLSIEGGERVLRSADGSTVRGASGVCDLCGSWNLMPLGVGIERIAEELGAAFPETPILRFDTDTIRTPAAARKAALRMHEPGALILGTEFMLPWLPMDKPLDVALVPSADSLLAVPFWRARERLVRLGLTLRERAVHTVMATRRSDDAAFAAITNPQTTDYFQEETSLRRVLGYPPFATLIAFQAQGAPDSLTAASERIAHAVAPHSLTVLPDRAGKGGHVRRSAVLRLAHGVWPDGALSDALARLPLSIRIVIDPESF